MVQSSRGVDTDHKIRRSTLPSTHVYYQPRRLIPNIPHPLSLRAPSYKIGRKHKAHRQQLSQSKPWREAEKGRGKGKGRFKMGNEESRIVDPSTPPQTLNARSLEALAEYIKDGRAKQIVVMVSSASPYESSYYSPPQDRRRHKYLRRHTRLSLPRNRPVRQPRAPKTSIRRSRLRHIVLSKSA